MESAIHKWDSKTVWETEKSYVECLSSQMLGYESGLSVLEALKSRGKSWTTDWNS